MSGGGGALITPKTVYAATQNTPIDLSSASADATGTNWTWTDLTKTLALNGVQIDINTGGSNLVGINLPADSHIVLTNNNIVAITATATSGASRAIYSTGAVNISGTGKLTATAGPTSGGNMASSGISVGTLTIETAEITATGGTATGNSIGIGCSALTMNSGKIVANGGASTSNAMSYGIFCSGALDIKTGTVSANAGSSANSNSYGINTSGAVTIGDASTGATVTATAGAAGTSNPGSPVSSYGLFTTSTLTINKSTVSGIGGIATGTGSTFNYGIVASGNIAITDSIITATGGNAKTSYGINGVGTISITNGFGSASCYASAATAKGAFNKNPTFTGVSFNGGKVYSDVSVTWGTPPTYTISFDANGGIGTMLDQTFTAGIPQNLTANAFTNTGKTFSGWATTLSGSVAYADSASYTATTDATLYAVWTSAPPKPEPGGGGTVTTNIPPQMESPVGHYAVIVSGNTTWSGNGNLTMKIDAPYDDFYAVEVNGVTISPDHYTATRGSTVVIFKESYLKKLSAGTHTVRFLFTSGVAQTNLIIKGAGATGGVADNPKTGDESNAVLYGVLIVLSLGVLLVLGRRAIKNKE